MNKFVISKKILYLFAIVFCFLIMQANVVNASTDYEVTMGSGASIRTTGEHQGLKFSATVNKLENVTEHGFYITLGEYDTLDFIEAIKRDNGFIGDNRIINKVVDGQNLNFNLVIYNIDEKNYFQDISVIAYIKYYNSMTNEETTSFSNALTRNIAEVVVKAYEASEDSDFVVNIYNKVIAVLNKQVNRIEILLDTTKYVVSSNSTQCTVALKQPFDYDYITTIITLNEELVLSDDFKLVVNNVEIEEGDYSVDYQNDVIVINYMIDDPNWTKPY